MEHLPFGLTGRPILSGRTGEIRDVDLGMPDRLASMQPLGSISLHTALTAQTVKGDEVGRADQRLGRWVEYEVMRGLRVGRPRREPETDEIFNEAIEFARRALATGSSSDLELAVEVIVGAFTEMASSWQAFGLSQDDAVVREFLGRTLEDRMYADLRELAEEVVATGQLRFIRALSTLSWRLLAAGLDNDAPLLVEFALGLGYGQVEALR